MEREAFEKYALDEIDIENAIADGLLSPWYNRLVVGKGPEGYVILNEQFPDYYKKLGIRLMFLSEDDISCLYGSGEVSLFFTDFFLLVYFPPKFETKEGIKLDGSRYSYRLFEGPDKPLVIPLKRLKEAQCSHSSSSFSLDKITQTQKESNIKNIVVGSVVGGPVGAVMGAAKKTKEVERIVAPTKIFMSENTHMLLEMEDGEKFLFENAVRLIDLEDPEKSANYRFNRPFLDQFEEAEIPQLLKSAVDFLIDRAKLKLPLEEQLIAIEKKYQPRRESLLHLLQRKCRP